MVLHRHRMVLVVALLLALIGGSSGATLFDRLSAGGWDNPDADSGQAAELLEEVFGQGQPNLVLLVTAPDGVDSPEAAEAGAALTERLAADPAVASVTSYWSAGQAPELRSVDGDRAVVLANLAGDADDASEWISEHAPDYQGAQGGVEVAVGGYAMFEHELTEQSETDIFTAELVIFPVTLVVLVLIFGSLVAAALPLVVAMVTVLLAMAVLWLLSGVTDLSVLAANVVTLLGLGLAIDYSLLLVNRFREELRAGRATQDAIGATMRTAGRTVVYSAVTVAIALSALVWFPLAALRSISYAGIATALLAGAVSLTVLPALFRVLGPRIERGRVLRRRTPGAAVTERGFWHRLASFVMRRPLPIATVTAGFLLLLGAPFLNLTVGQVDERTMPESSEARQVATSLRTEFGVGEQDAVQVVVPELAAPPDALAAYAAELSRLDRVAWVDTATGRYAGGDQAAPATPAHERFLAGEAAYLSVVPEAGEPEQAQQLVRDVRAAPAPFDTLVGGGPAVAVDGNQALTDWLPYSLVSLAVAMIVLLFLLTGSVVLPLLALVLSGLSLTATFGALVWIFQDGNLSGMLGGFAVTGNLAGTIPVMLFAVGFGLAMDYQVFMLSRIREEYQRIGDSTAAVATGLERIGRIVTAAAILISIVFLAFLLSDITLMKAFGLGLPLAVLLDATLVRGALLPAAMKLAGRATWWAPAPLRRLHARFGLREEEAVEPARAEPVAV